MVYHDDYRGDEAVGGGLAPIQDFLELPMVDGVAPLAVALPGLLVYRTGEVRTARELIGVFAEEGGCGERAALELLAAGARSLIDGAEAGRDRGLRSHGSLDPWRVAVDHSGEVRILGYGLPCLDVVDFLEDPELLPPSDTLRYCPPERIDGDVEDVTSDLFSLALIVAEFATGRPVYPGRGEDLLDAARQGPTPDQLGLFPPGVAKLLEPLFSRIHSRRTAAAQDLVATAHAAAAAAEGRSLAELISEAAPFLSDVEDELPPTFAIHDLLPPIRSGTPRGRRPARPQRGPPPPWSSWRGWSRPPSIGSMISTPRWPRPSKGRTRRSSRPRPCPRRPRPPRSALSEPRTPSWPARPRPRPSPTPRPPSIMQRRPSEPCSRPWC